MIEIIALVVVMAGLARFARGRGVKPAVAIGVAVGGYLILVILLGQLIRGPNARWIILATAWAWVGIVVFYVRFVVGARRPTPDRDWVCQSCMYPNGSHAVVCEACQQPWVPAS
jgi:hypothetical protein